MASATQPPVCPSISAHPPRLGRRNTNLPIVDWALFLAPPSGARSFIAFRFRGLHPLVRICPRLMSSSPPGWGITDSLERSPEQRIPNAEVLGYS